jgi:hypothetical protein
MLGPWVGVILEDDKQKPARQRHTAKRIFDRLQVEYGFTGGYTTIKNYVRGEHVRGREMFVPLLHPPGEAQVDFPSTNEDVFAGSPDFGETLVIIAGLECKAHFLVTDLATPATKTCRRGPRWMDKGLSPDHRNGVPQNDGEIVHRAHGAGQFELRELERARGRGGRLETDLSRRDRAAGPAATGRVRHEMGQEILLDQRPVAAQPEGIAPLF